MHEIVCVGDVHEGLNFDFRIDPETGISERALDLHGNFAKAAQWAIEHQASLFCVLGDLFDRAHVAPVFREMVRKDVIEPLGAAGIEVWILAGNHDEPRRTARSTSLDDYRGYAHVKVFRSPKVEIREVDGRKMGFILIPYMHPEQVVEQVRQALGKEVPRELAYEAARQTWKEWIHNRATDLSAVDVRVLFGHFEFQGVRYASTAPSEVVPNDFTFTPEMVPDAVDLVVFGHIHMHQTIGGKIVYAGAPERIDWGERLDPKGFLALRPEGTWSFIELPARPMDKVEAAVGMGDDVTDKVPRPFHPKWADTSFGSRSRCPTNFATASMRSASRTACATRSITKSSSSRRVDPAWSRKSSRWIQAACSPTTSTRSSPIIQSGRRSKWRP